jgi:hypothetical protein
MQATMEATIRDLTDWLQGVFPGGKIEQGWTIDDAYLLFRVYREDGKRSEIQFAKIALEDYASAEILRDLRRAIIAKQLQARTSHRFTYGPRREVTGTERMVVTCDGHMYRVVRDLNRTVAVFDDEDRPLKNMPPRLVLPDSIFHRPVQQWRAEIGAWTSRS